MNKCWELHCFASLIISLYNILCFLITNDVFQNLFLVLFVYILFHLPLRFVFRHTRWTRLMLTLFLQFAHISYIIKFLLNIFLQDEEVMMTEYLSLNGGEYISKYVANIDGLTRRELFAGYCLAEPNRQKDAVDTIDKNREVSYYEL